MYHQVKSEIDIHVNYGSGCPNIVRCYGYFYDEKRYEKLHEEFPDLCCPRPFVCPHPAAVAAATAVAEVERVECSRRGMRGGG